MCEIDVAVTIGCCIMSVLVGVGLGWIMGGVHMLTLWNKTRKLREKEFK
jgi:hypothetical protein